MGAPVVHFEIMGGKGVDLETFYRGLFGWKIDSNNPMKYGIVNTGGAGGINGGVGVANDGSSVFRYMPRLTIYRQHSTGRRNSAARQSSRRPKCLAALSWPCSPIQQATSMDSFWGKRANG